ncbi:hypothetical protein GGF44_004601 [Coemansia sp. RSA 1694]|nr:hypothetical protein GGF44_004601 [Coemansia sp. RSA 1694]
MDFIDHSRYSLACLAKFRAILQHESVVSYAEHSGSLSYEIHIVTVEEADGQWVHRLLTNSNHAQWQHQAKQPIDRRNVLPRINHKTMRAYRGGGSHDARRQVMIRRLDVARAGWGEPNVRALLSREIQARERLSKLRLPGVAAYMGCTVDSDGLVTGVALGRCQMSLEYALSVARVPCRDLLSRDLVDSVAALQRLGSAIGRPISPSAVMVDGYGRLVLVSVDCIARTWVQGRPGASDPLAPVFARLCSTTSVANSSSPARRSSCGRSVCQFSPLGSHVLAVGPHHSHRLVVATGGGRCYYQRGLL